MKKRILSLLMTLVIMLSLLSGLTLTASATVSFNGGNGTRNDPFLIATAEQLAYFRDLVNGGNDTLCAKVVADIDLGGASWTPIGLTKSGYNGMFDGCGHLISNLRIDSISNSISITQSDGSKHTINVGGLFGVVGVSGTVRCLGISGVVTGSISSSKGNGLYIGSLIGTTFGMVEECFSTCDFTNLTIKNNDYIGIGGLIGNSQPGGTVRNCYNTGSITATASGTKSTHRIYIGGLIGLGDSRVENCYAACPVNVTITTGLRRFGGVTGNAGGKDFYNCYFDNQLCSATYTCGCAFDTSTPFDPPYCMGKTTEVLRSDKMPGVLGNVFMKDTNWVNKGYPILAVMTYGLEDENWSQWFEDEAMGDNVDKEVFNSLIPPELQNKDLTSDITRLEFCAVAVQLYEQMGGPKLDASMLDSPFIDTSADVVRKAYALGITNGISATQFDPYSLISREQLATMLTRVYKALNLPGWTLANDGAYRLDYSGVTPFADDANISAYAKPSVYFMVKNEVIKGMSATIFAPRNTTPYETAIGYANASREQALIMAVRMFKKL